MAKNGTKYAASVVAVLVVIALVMSTVVFSLIGLSSGSVVEEVLEVPEELVEVNPSDDMAVPSTEPGVTAPTSEPVS
jgi:hypothetical protein